MRASPTSLPGVLLIEPKVIEDERGFFLESFNQRAFDEMVGTRVVFVQDNCSRSAAGVLRGLHLQIAPHAQGKLVSVSNGRAFDVAVDVRRDSPAYGRWEGVELDARSRRQLWIPPGFAHGFLALEDDTDVHYKVTDFYDKDCERAIAWNDPAIGIQWPLIGMTLRLAARDAAAPALSHTDFR